MAQGYLFRMQICFWVIWILYYNVSTWENDILKVLINWIRVFGCVCFESVDDRNRHDVKDGSQVKFILQVRRDQCMWISI